MLGIGKTRQHIGSCVKYIWKIKSGKTAKLGGNKILDYFLPKIFMSFREGTNMLVKCLHIFTLLFLIFRSILTFVVGRWCCCCLSALECTQEEEPLLSARGFSSRGGDRFHTATLPRLLFPSVLSGVGRLLDSGGITSGRGPSV